MKLLSKPSISKSRNKCHYYYRSHEDGTVFTTDLVDELLGVHGFLGGVKGLEQGQWDVRPVLVLGRPEGQPHCHPISQMALDEVEGFSIEFDSSFFEDVGVSDKN